MTDSASFIGNEDDVRRFHAVHIAPYAIDKKQLAFTLLPLARRKYCADLATSNVPLSSKIFHSATTEDQFVRLIRRYEVKPGVFVDKNDKSIPQSAVAMYMTVNVQNEVEGYMKLQSVLNQRLYDMSRNVSIPAFNVTKEYKSALHKSALSHFVKYDVDTKEARHITALRSVLRENDIKLHLVVETHGGYHMVIDNRTGYPNDKNSPIARAALKEFVGRNKEWIAQENNQAQIVIPGTYQGGFLTSIVYNWTGY